ncbi:chromosome partitioning protein ParA [Photobacterium damselae]|uniref:chromosome partitioning protein ParA n=1 Tax=Photobacterium damselae TaxID=38293 RepID=UPI0030F3D52A
MKLLPLLLMVLLSGCNQSNEKEKPIPPPLPQVTEIIKTPELVEELKAQPTIDDQFSVLYDKFDHILDRSESLTGPDENNDGIRDDIGAFIDALEVEEPVRNALKQEARYFQNNLKYDWSENTDANIDKAMAMGGEFLKVIACQDFVGIDIDDLINISNTITALTYNTKARTMAYLKYNHLKDGSVRTLLPAEAQYCE